MRLNQFEYLLALDRYGTFSKAAEKLYVSQPCISMAIKELEAELGCSLLTRNNQGLSFTEAGKLALTYSETIERAISGLRSISAGNDPSGTLVTMGGTAFLCNFILLDIVLEFNSRSDGTRISLIEQDSETIVNSVADGNMDIGVIYGSNIDRDNLSKQISKGNLVCGELFQLNLCIAVSQQHPLARKAEISLEELLQYPYVTNKIVMEDGLNEIFLRQHFTNIVRISNAAALRQAITRLNGFTLVPQFALESGNSSYTDTLVEVHSSDFALDTTVCWVRPKQSSAISGQIIDRLICRCKEIEQQTPF